MAKAAGQRAPLDHYWSLAIEEQFYLLWPLALLALLAVARRRRLVAFAAVWAAFVVVAITIAVGWGGSASYLATPARLPEIIVGAVLAVAIHEGRRIPASRWLAGAGLVVIVGSACRGRQRADRRSAACCRCSPLRRSP